MARRYASRSCDSRPHSRPPSNGNAHCEPTTYRIGPHTRIQPTPFLFHRDARETACRCISEQIEVSSNTNCSLRYAVRYFVFCNCIFHMDRNAYFSNPPKLSDNSNNAHARSMTSAQTQSARRDCAAGRPDNSVRAGECEQLEVYEATEHHRLDRFGIHVRHIDLVMTIAQPNGQRSRVDLLHDATAPEARL